MAQLPDKLYRLPGTRNFGPEWLKDGVIGVLRRNALKGRFGGTSSKFDQTYLESCRGYHQASGALIVFTRDYGYHSSGWWKAPDYEFCWHLSLSFADPETGTRRDHDHALAEEWVHAAYGPGRGLVWSEPPAYKAKTGQDVWHYRLFTDSTYKHEILPRGEVYSKQFTERGWLSWSDRQALLRQQQQKELEILLNSPDAGWPPQTQS